MFQAPKFQINNKVFTSSKQCKSSRQGKAQAPSPIGFPFHARFGFGYKKDKAQLTGQVTLCMMNSSFSIVPIHACMEITIYSLYSLLIVLFHLGTMTKEI